MFESAYRIHRTHCIHGMLLGEYSALAKMVGTEKTAINCGKEPAEASDCVQDETGKMRVCDIVHKADNADNADNADEADKADKADEVNKADKTIKTDKADKADENCQCDGPETQVVEETTDEDEPSDRRPEPGSSESPPKEKKQRLL